MKKSNTLILKQNIKKQISKEIDTEIELIENKYSFTIQMDLCDNKPLKSNIDEIINFWTLPNVLNKKYNLDEVCNILVAPDNEIPLWIGIKIDESNFLVYLIISKRFRSYKIIKEFHSSNNFAPIISFNQLKKCKLTPIEFHFLYPSSMLENQKLKCQELDEILNILNISIKDFDTIDKEIEKNVENKKGVIYIFESKEDEENYVLVDTYNKDQINVLDIVVSCKGVNSELVNRSLMRWNTRLWNGLGPKIKKLENNFIKIKELEERKLKRIK